MASAFFYGTLMHPKILKRVLNSDANHLQICPAILTDYTRHKVKFEDYPAIIPGERSKKLLGRELTAEENRIRGTMVKGLTAEDITYLDVFESGMYERLHVLVYPLGPFTSVPADTTGSSEAEDDNLIPTGPTPLATISELAQPIEAQTYVWCLEDSDLETELWSFDEFIRESAWRWIDSGAEDNEDYAEVDEARERWYIDEETDSDEA